MPLTTANATQPAAKNPNSTVISANVTRPNAGTVVETIKLPAPPKIPNSPVSPFAPKGPTTPWQGF